MSVPRFAALLAVAGSLFGAFACAIEPDPAAVEDCKPGEIQCLTGGRIRTCTGDGLWGPSEAFVCAFGSCTIMDDVPVCM
jgi:hypothetical protein